MSKLIVRFLLACMGIMLLSCAHQPAEKYDNLSAAGYAVLLEQSYGTDEKQTFDIFLPEGGKRKDSPLLIMIHGGYWNGGDKNDFYSLIEQFQTALPECAFATVNYRLKYPFPAQEMDVKACVEYLIGNRNEYGLSGKFVILGGSAGAHLSVLYAYKYTCSPRPSAVVNMVGPVNVTGLMKRITEKLTPDDSLKMLTLYRTSSPLLYVNPDSPPMLMLYGETDELVSVAQAIALRQRLEECGVPHVCHIFPNTGHSLKGEGEAFMMKELGAYLAKYLEISCYNASQELFLYD